ncbi:conserved unknown protein [Ectocarpus siliculosus]|uniref:Uncharacterized protein n=1 Tax=Ectocarpus siliculosus TaxID=2880 RepID=D7FYS3_ECTSI|nr:conserved unknown protein [Ectocarpus siliculosus]|eukprot:CBJ26565.1 conserved unknown protein [Ectocarpus siliculosus]
MADQTAATTTSTSEVKEVELDGRGKLKLEVNWGVGIGGGLWSTGILLTEHLAKHAALYDRVFKGKRVLELGSGTGLVGLAAARFGPPLEVVITDLESHVDICKRNVASQDDMGAQGLCSVRVEAYDWSSEVPEELGEVPFDVILATDVAYYEHLYAPFVQALERTAGQHTLVLLGVTRTDTGPAFFDALDKAGFVYNLVDQASHKGFGLFTVQREQPDERPTM